MSFPARLSSWDEWVPQERLLKYNDINLAKQKVINAESYAADKKAKAAASSGSGTSKSGGASGGGRKDGRAHEGSRKRRRDDVCVNASMVFVNFNSILFTYRTMV